MHGTICKCRAPWQSRGFITTALPWSESSWGQSHSRLGSPGRAPALCGSQAFPGTSLLVVYFGSGFSCRPRQQQQYSSTRHRMTLAARPPPTAI